MNSNRLRAGLSALWYWYAQAIGVLAVAAGLSLLIVFTFATSGPVITVTSGPSNITDRVPIGGDVSYRVSVRRHASCPGNVVVTLSSGAPYPDTIVVNRPVNSVDMGVIEDATVHFTLPRTVYPGKWRYRAMLDSKCPTYSQQDTIADFDFEVIGPVPGMPDLSALQLGGR